MERTLIILKPDCMKNALISQVFERFFKADLKILACKMTRLSKEILSIHYAHVANKDFFPSIVEYMSSTPVMIAIFEGQNAIQKVRDLLGPTDSTIAPKGTIRGDFGKSKTENIAHASDGIKTAAEEIARFFKEDEIYTW